MKKVLIISEVPTSPVIAGNRACISAYAKLLSSYYDVYFLYISPNVNNADYMETAKEWGEHFFSYKTNIIQNHLNSIVYRHKSMYNFLGVDFFYPWFLHKKVNSLQQKYSFDGIIINYIWLSKIGLKIKNVPIILYTHDVFTFRNKKLGSSHWITCTPNEEAKCINRVNYVLAIQERDNAFYQYLSYKSKVFTIYTPFFPNFQPVTLNHNILFFSGDNELNIKCIRAFVMNCLPYLTKHLPKLELHIGGKICQKLGCLPEFTDAPHVILHGTFTAPSEFYSLGDIVINPVDTGTGLKIKTFEAISYGKTVIASSHSIEGVFKKDEAPVYIADSKEEYLYFLERNLLQIKMLQYNQNKAQAWLHDLNDYIAKIFMSII